MQKIFLVYIFFFFGNGVVLANPIQLSTDIYLKGIIAERSLNYEKAVDFYSQAIKLSPNSSLFYLRRAQLYAQLKKNKLASSDFSQAIKVDANHMDLYNKRIKFNQSVGNYQEVVADYSILLEKFPHQYAKSSTYFERCLVLEKLKKVSKSSG